MQLQDLKVLLLFYDGYTDEYKDNEYKNFLQYGKCLKIYGLTLIYE